jgi:thiamine biosynthesis lipoprotein
VAPDTLVRAFAPVGFVTATWEALGTSILLRLCGSGPSERGRDGDAPLATARRAVEHELDAIDRACSRFRADSELSRVNASSGRPTAVSELFAQALELAMRAAELTEGDVDPTVGRTLELAGYDRDWKSLTADREPIETGARARPPLVLSAHVRASWRTIEFDREALIVRVPRGISLDLGATAKAFVADRAAAAAALAAQCGALVSVGGDRSDLSAPGQTVSIRSGGLATSSTSVRRWSQRGRSMHHIIDPRTGQPSRSSWRTVSVAGASCTDANIAATAAIVRSWRGARWLAQVGLPARMVDRRGEVTTVAGWPHEAGR